MLYRIILSLAILTLAVSCSSISVVHDKKTADSGESAIPEEAIESPPLVVEERTPGNDTEETEYSGHSNYQDYNSSDESIPTNQLGWRVQIYNTDKKIEAEQVEKEARKEMGLQIYSEYEPPYYKLRVGNCKTPEEAEELLERVKEHGYENAWIIQCRIIVR
ncbi:SPOR domain-containing protein [bacterium]|nr:SPOR domain-containing protein [bacterium]